MTARYEVAEPSGNRGRRVTILSIDGGGVRGVIPATILEQLETYLQVCSHHRILLFSAPKLIVFQQFRVSSNALNLDTIL